MHPTQCRHVGGFVYTCTQHSVHMSCDSYNIHNSICSHIKEMNFKSYKICSTQSRKTDQWLGLLVRSQFLGHALLYLFDLVLVVGMVGIVWVQEIELSIASFIVFDALLKFTT